MANDISLSPARMNLPTLASGSIESYLQAVSSIPVLEQDDEQQLAPSCATKATSRPPRSSSCPTCVSWCTSRAATLVTACRSPT